MNDTTRLGALALLAMVLAAPVGAAGGQADTSALVGVWRVDEISLRRPGGGGTNPDPQPGLFMFTRDHYSIAWIPRPDPRAAFATPWKPTAAEIETAYATILFNAGTYEVTDATLTTRPVISKVPELSGGHAVYEYRLEQDSLWLTMVDEYAADGTRAPWVGNVSFPLKLTRIE